MVGTWLALTSFQSQMSLRGLRARLNRRRDSRTGTWLAKASARLGTWSARNPVGSSRRLGLQLTAYAHSSCERAQRVLRCPFTTRMTVSIGATQFCLLLGLPSA